MPHPTYGRRPTVCFNTGLFCATAVLIDFCKKHDWHDERGFSLSSRCWGLQLMTFFLERIIRVKISMFLVIFSIVLAMFAVEVATSNRGLGLAMFCLFFGGSIHSAQNAAAN
jgi:hypothetical protein